MPERRLGYSDRRGFQPPIGERRALLPERDRELQGWGFLTLILDAWLRHPGCRARLREVVGHCPVNAVNQT
jgi:hypothetical protein